MPRTRMYGRRLLHPRSSPHQGASSRYVIVHGLARVRLREMRGRFAFIWVIHTHVRGRRWLSSRVLGHTTNHAGLRVPSMPPSCPWRHRVFQRRHLQPRSPQRLRGHCSHRDLLRLSNCRDLGTAAGHLESIYWDDSCCVMHRPVIVMMNCIRLLSVRSEI
jgi:hypothetical protein